MSIIYISTLREAIEAFFEAREIEDEELMFEYLHFKLLQSWNL